MIKFRAFAITLLGATLPFATASSASALPLPKTDELSSLGSAESNHSNSENLSVEAHAAERGDSSLVSVTWSLENNRESRIIFNWPSGTTYMYGNALHYSGVTAHSPSEGTRFHPLMDANGDCFCSGVTSVDFKKAIDPGQKVAYWSMFSIPDNVDTIDLEIPGFEPIEDIPIS
ncbi:hypothetical protein [Nocardiopsis metallicus]|uniref:Uncharacterized protein n=1 Tax=Nocardiopsis metallicus TaxID=179819 RepID=A0A840WJR7_9ACTN|nr:hypothetical protein [Nocardiopsis metallicus]MBB5495723.1 hypothetical protein [Nocardiopsis metallicus]